jgi:hypothetical protein
MNDVHPTVAGFFYLLLAWIVYQVMRKFAAMKEKNCAAHVEADTAASGFPPGL